VGARLNEATLSDKQAILQLVIERIIVGEGSLEIRHVIPVSASQPGSDGPNAANAQLRPDGMHAAALPRGAEDRGENVTTATSGSVAVTRVRHSSPREFRPVIAPLLRRTHVAHRTHTVVSISVEQPCPVIRIFLASNSSALTGSRC